MFDLFLFTFALIAAGKLGGGWAVVLCFCVLLFLLPEDNKK